MVPEWLHIVCINWSPGSTKRIGARRKTPSAIRFLIYWYLSGTFHSRLKSAWFVHRFRWWLSNDILIMNEKMVSHLSRQTVWKPNLTAVSRIRRLQTDCCSLFSRQSLSRLHIRFMSSALPNTQWRKLASPSKPRLLWCWALLGGPNIDVDVTHSSAGRFKCRTRSLSSI